MEEEIWRFGLFMYVCMYVGRLRYVLIFPLPFMLYW